MIPLLLCLIIVFGTGMQGLMGQDEREPSNSTPPMAASEENLLLRIEKAFSDVKTVQARFIQEKNLIVLQGKVVLKGRMALENPGRFVWHVEEPVRYGFILTDKSIRQWDEDTQKVQEMRLSNNPIFEVVEKQLTGWFSGRYRDLLSDYEMEILQEDPCRLSFVPRESSMVHKALRKVTVELRGDLRYIQSIDIEDLNGDRTTFSFEDTQVNIPIAPGEWEIVPREP